MPFFDNLVRDVGSGINNAVEDVGRVVGGAVRGPVGDSGRLVEEITGEAERLTQQVAGSFSRQAGGENGLRLMQRVPGDPVGSWNRSIERGKGLLTDSTIREWLRDGARKIQAVSGLISSLQAAADRMTNELTLINEMSRVMSELQDGNVGSSIKRHFRRILADPAVGKAQVRASRAGIEGGMYIGFAADVSVAMVKGIFGPTVEVGLGMGSMSGGPDAGTASGIFSVGGGPMLGTTGLSAGLMVGYLGPNYLRHPHGVSLDLELAASLSRSGGRIAASRLGVGAGAIFQLTFPEFGQPFPGSFNEVMQGIGVFAFPQAVASKLRKVSFEVSLSYDRSWSF